MRVLVYSHAYVVAANHAKLERLARMPDVELSLICPRRVRRELMTVAVEEIFFAIRFNINELAV